MRRDDDHQRRRPLNQRPRPLRKSPQIIPQRLHQRRRLRVKSLVPDIAEIGSRGRRGGEDEFPGRVADGEGGGDEVGKGGAVGGGEVAQAVEVED